MFSALGDLAREIELANSFKQVVVRLDETDFDRLSEKQMRLEIKRIQKQARKAMTKRTGF